MAISTCRFTLSLVSSNFPVLPLDLIFKLSSFLSIIDKANDINLQHTSRLGFNSPPSIATPPKLYLHSSTQSDSLIFFIKSFYI